MCTGSEFQVAGAETKNVPDKKLSVMPDGLARRLVLEHTRTGMGSTKQLIQRDMEGACLQHAEFTNYQRCLTPIIVSTGPHNQKTKSVKAVKTMPLLQNKAICYNTE